MISLIYPKEILPFNRLVCNTENFFVIVGYGAFVKSYALIITKELIPSFANIDVKNLDEFFWLRSLINKLNRSGPSIEPCGTPAKTFFAELKLLLI